MPLANTPSPRTYVSDPTLPIPADILPRYSPQTQQRHVFARWIETRYKRPTVNLREATLHYLRAAGILAPHERWSKRKTPQIVHTLGTACVAWIKTSGTVHIEEALGRLRAFREDEDVLNHAPVPPATPVWWYNDQPDTHPLPNPPDQLAVDPAELRAYTRRSQHNARHDFADWLEKRRNGECNPRRMYRQWRNETANNKLFDPQNITGLTKFSHTAPDALDTLGSAAMQYICDTPRAKRDEIIHQMRSL